MKSIALPPLAQFLSSFSLNSVFLDNSRIDSRIDFPARRIAILVSCVRPGFTFSL